MPRPSVPRRRLGPCWSAASAPINVTALDYSRISQRFYEDLPDLPDVTLVAEPKAHPAILDSFPGPICTTGDVLEMVQPNRIYRR